MTITRIPVYLITGFLGSGKTTLLCRWLRTPALRDAAVIVNEIGEVGYDDQILAAASDTPSLIANACVCCTGLPGLEEALESLFWARLQRRMPAFPSVVIETTGLADPGPVIAAFDQVPLLRERYRLAGVITTLSVTAAETVLAHHAEARSQIAHAQVLVLTKTDLAQPAHTQALSAQLRELNTAAAQLQSANGALDWCDVEAALRAVEDDKASSGSTMPNHAAANKSLKIEHDQPSNTSNFDHAHLRADDDYADNDRHDNIPNSRTLRDPALEDHPLGNRTLADHGRFGLDHHSHDQDHADAHHHPDDDRANDHHDHVHDAITTFVVMSEVLAYDQLIARLHALANDFGPSLLRVKGWVQLDDGKDASVQLSIGNGQVEVQVLNQSLSTISGRRHGLTVICRGSPARAGLILSMPA